MVDRHKQDIDVTIKEHLMLLMKRWGPNTPLIEVLINKIVELENELNDVKYRYELRKDIED